MLKDIFSTIIGLILLFCGGVSFSIAFSEMKKSHFGNAFFFIIYFVIGFVIGGMMLVAVILT